MTTASKIAHRVLSDEAQALESLARDLPTNFDAIISHLQHIKGRVVLTGVGKSGHVARKIAATLASTGCPAYYVHPTEASHGDMGMITGEDSVIALSKSGETHELADIIGYCRRFSVPLIAMTAGKESALAKAANHTLLLPDVAEACAETRAPTTSTTLQIAMGDAIAVALLETKGFTASDFKTYHPGGTLGASLLTAQDIMHTDDHRPLITHMANMSEALQEMSEKAFGCVGVTENGQLIGIITDGDIRRHMGANFLEKSVLDVMTPSPITASSHDLAADILRRMTGEKIKIMQMFIVENDAPVGIVHLHDFLRAGLA